MPFGQLSIIKEKHKKLPLKFSKHRMSKCPKIADIEFPMVVVVVVYCHFHVKHNLGYVRWSCGWVGCFTMNYKFSLSIYCSFFFKMSDFFLIFYSCGIPDLKYFLSGLQEGHPIHIFVRRGLVSIIRGTGDTKGVNKFRIPSYLAYF